MLHPYSYTRLTNVVSRKTIWIILILFLYFGEVVTRILRVQHVNTDGHLKLIVFMDSAQVLTLFPSSNYLLLNLISGGPRIVFDINCHREHAQHIRSKLQTRDPLT